MYSCAVTTCTASVARRAPGAAVLPKRGVACVSLRATSRRPTAAAAAAAPAAATPVSASQQHNNTLPFVRPGSAGWPRRDPLYKWDQVLPEPWAEPPASGLDSAPLIAPARPTTYGTCTSDAWASPATFIDLNAGVSPCFAGMTDLQWRTAAVRNPCLVGRIDTLMAATEWLWPDTAPHQLRRLSHECGPALALVAPGGTSALADLPGFDLLALYQRAAACVDELAAKGEHGRAVQAALAALQLLSHLRFGSAASAEPYKALRVQLQAALGAAASQPAVRIEEQQVLGLMEACVRADRHLWLTPWVCHRWTAAVDAYLASGWFNSELAVKYVERWCALVARGRLHWAPRLFQRMAEAPLRHEQLTTAQMGRLLAAEAALPAHHTSGMNGWLARWTADLSRRRADRMRAFGMAPAVPAAASVPALAKA